MLPSRLYTADIDCTRATFVTGLRSNKVVLRSSYCPAYFANGRGRRRRFVSLYFVSTVQR